MSSGGPLKLLPHSVRETLISLAFSGRGIKRVVNGVSVRVDPRSRRTFAEAYDPSVADYLRTNIRRGDEVWNVGANVGVYAVQLMHWLNGTGGIVAFEPNPNSAELLESNVRLNGPAANVRIVRKAVGEQPGTVEFFLSGTDGMSRAGRPNPELPQTERAEVAVTTLDDFAEAHGRAPDWIVMDIEGWEIAALRGGRKVLETASVVVEMHPSAWEWSGHSRADVERLVEELQLEVVPLEGQGDPLGEYGAVLLRKRAEPTA